MTRKERLQKLTDEYHSQKYGDYNITYAEFASLYGLEYEDNEVVPDVRKCERCDGRGDDPFIQGGQPCQACNGKGTVQYTIPRYAITLHDETYSMVEVFDTIDDAINGLLGAVGNDTLNIPGHLIDLDTGDVLGWEMQIKVTGKVEDVPYLSYLKENAS